MVFDYFKKKLSGTSASGDPKGAALSSGIPAEDLYKPDARKAGSWFKHAQNAADTKNYDYAIECYVNGLKFDPDNMHQHEMLRDVAIRRKIAGGKPMGMFESMKSGKAPADKYAHALMVWSKSPLDMELAIGFMDAGATFQPYAPDLHISEVIHWVAETFLIKGQIDKEKTPGKKLYLKTRDILVGIGDFPLAIVACKFAVNFTPDDAQLMQELKNLEAEQTMAAGGYVEGVKEKGGFMRSVKDLNKQRELDDGDRVSQRSESAQDELIVKRRAEYDENPEDISRLNRLVEALLQKATEPAENEAIKVLHNALEQTGQYRFRVRIGDILMKQMTRQLRELKARYDAAPDDAAVKNRYLELARKKLQLELEEFADRAKNYPTDMPVRFELGKRLFLAKRYDDAIAAFQEAQADAKVRIGSMQHLGMCYLAKGWFDEAVETLGKAIEAYPITDDKTALDLRYLLMDALDNSARKAGNLDQARRALGLASQIVQTSITYRDIRDRLDRLKKLVDTLSNKG